MELRPLGLLVLLIALPAAAAPPLGEDIVVTASRDAQLESLARASGLSVNDVKMVLGLRRPGYTEYVREYAWSHRRLRAALGTPRYDALFAREGRLDERLAAATGDAIDR